MTVWPNVSFPPILPRAGVSASDPLQTLGCFEVDHDDAGLLPGLNIAIGIGNRI
jgi:hypothetical protein